MNIEIVVSSSHNKSIYTNLPAKQDNNSRDFEVHDDLIKMANEDGGSHRISFLMQHHEINNTAYTIMITICSKKFNIG